jgi:alkane 1-monooxygenase
MTSAAASSSTVRTEPHGLAFALSLLPAGLLPLSWWLGERTAMPNLFAWFTLAIVFVTVPIAERVLGQDLAQPDNSIRHSRWYRAIPLMCLPLQIAQLAFGAWVFAKGGLAWHGAIGWVISCGVMSGVIAIKSAHELVHRRSRLEQWAGGVLMASVCYGTYPIEHVYGHHVDVGKPDDPVTARFGESFHAFFLRALRGNFMKGWRLARERLAMQGRSLLSPHNPLLWWYAISAVFAVSLWCAFGAAGLLFFFAQAFVAVQNLEAVSYIEHYGLTRARLPDGSYEKVGPQHSWDANWTFTNWLLINLQRHPDHHQFARRPYQLLRSEADSPQLPAGYGAMVPLALIPPLWHRVIDPRLSKYLAARGQRFPA